MLTDEQAVQLHQRSVMGQSLTAEEQAELEAWYKKRDEEEAKMLKLDDDDDDLAEIRQKLNASLNQLVLETQRLRQIEMENEALRHEVARLLQQYQARLLPEAA